MRWKKRRLDMEEVERERRHDRELQDREEKRKQEDEARRERLAVLTILDRLAGKLN